MQEKLLESCNIVTLNEMKASYSLYEGFKN